jgi:hypothetical protein
MARSQWSVEKIITAVEQATPVFEPDVRGLPDAAA